MLQQLAAAAKQDRQGQHEGARTALQQLAATVGPAHPTQAVQNGLQATQQQLSGLLDRHSRVQRQRQDLESSQAGKPSLSVLQQLLQLAVGDTRAALAQQLATCLEAAGRLPPAAQQQQWCAAAAEALQLFSADELARLPMHSLHQAILLQPQLLTQLLQAAAAAVLQPVLQQQAGPCSCPITASSMSQALAAVLPGWQQLPAVLATSPELLLQASADLLSWLQAAGHQRPWQLTSCLLRPAWQQLMAAATPGSSTSNGLAAPGLPGALWLACPEAQQQRLLQQLVQEPSAGGLLQLLEQLPGLPQVTPLPGTCWEKAQDVGTATWVSMGASNRALQLDDAAAAGAAAAEDSDDDGELANGCWPSWQEWQGTGGAAPTRHSKAAGVIQQPQQQQLDLLKVLGAWQLVVQHRCWYEFALHQLVSCCLQHVAAHQQQQLPDDPVPAAEPQLTAAAAAAAFISWVQQPTSPDRQAHVQQQLLAPMLARHTPAAALVQHAAQDQPTAEQGRLRQEQLLQACRQLLANWQQAALPLQQAEACCPDGAAAAPIGNSSSSKARSNWISLACLLDVDLPVALLQQQELLLGLPAQQLLQQLFPGSLAARPAAAAAAAEPAAAAVVRCAAVDALDGISAAALELFTAALQRAAGAVNPHPQPQGASQHAEALNCSHWLARQWLRALSSCPVITAGATAAHTAAGCSALPTQAPLQQLQQQHICGGVVDAADDSPWTLPGGSSVVSRKIMATAKQLLVAATACDKQLRAHG